MLGGTDTRGGARRRILSAAVAASALLILLVVAPAAAGFVERGAPVNSGRLFDLGVSDYDRDDSFEIFSTNHKFKGTLTEGRPGSWTSLMGPTGFSPTPEFPGFEDLLNPPEIDAPGLYIYAESRLDGGGNQEEDPRLHFVAEEVDGIPLLPEKAEGTISLPSPKVQVVRRQGAEVDVSRSERLGRTVIRFSVAEQGHITLKVKKVDLPPIQVDIEDAPLLANTFVGANRVQAHDSSFTLRLADRHGIAWADGNGDELIDALVVRGGLGGGISNVAGQVADEFLVTDVFGIFRDRIADSGIAKRACRARQVAAIDFNGDGLLDYFTSCKAAKPRLYLGLERAGTYRGVSEPLWEAGRAGSFYRWLDLRGDSRPELLVASKGRVDVLRYTRKGAWVRAQRVRTQNRASLVYAAAVGDFDRDGDPDVFVGATSGNTLLRNAGRRLVAVDPSELGLPRRGSGASWVDYDNDGRLDLYSYPSGLYRQRKSGNFRKTDRVRDKRSALWGMTSWADFDLDGDRDAVSAGRLAAGEADVRTRFRENVIGSARRWLQVEVDHPDGEAGALGAKVTIRSASGKQSGWVGESEGSRFSQGHYRVYFGLGSDPQVDRLVVRWSDGTVRRFRNLEPDRLLKISP